MFLLKKEEGGLERKKETSVNSYFTADPSSQIKFSSNQTFSLDGCH